MRLFLLTILSMVTVNVFAQNPQITVSRTSITTSVNSGGTTTQTFVITNTGNRDLTWNAKTKGVPVTFTKPAYADWTQATNQDRLTPSVWLTRQNNQGLFNIASQSAYNSTAPAGTSWAFGKSEDLEVADYQTWQTAVGGDPQSMIGNVISMRSIAEDRYFDIVFDSFSGSNTGGGFSYTRQEHGSKWTSLDFTSGTLIPGQSKTVTVTFNASSLVGASHAGLLVIESNDPVNSEKIITTSLNIVNTTGSPEISTVTSKDLGNGYVNFATQKTITINNIGTGILTVSNVVASNPAFVPEATNFAIAPGQGYDLRIQFIPSTAGFVTGNITLTNNDSDEGTLAISVSANALGSPVVGVSSISLNKTIASGSTVAESFTLSNNGVSDLTYNLSFNLGRSTPVVFSRTNFTDPMLPENQDRVSADVLITRDYEGGWFNAANETYFNSSVSPNNTVWAAESTASALANGTDYYNWRSAIDGEANEMVDVVTSMYLPLEDRYFDIVVRQWTCCQNGGGFTYERTEVYNWLTASASTGTIASGANTTFDLQFNTKGLRAGTYQGTFTISSNDPATPVRNIPVTINVTGTPEARVHESSVAFGSIPVGTSVRKKIRVINDGATALNITSVTYTDSELTTYEATGTVNPLTAGVIEIAFAPTAIESYSGNITLTTDDPANPTFQIPYTAAGVAAGEINVVAADLNASVSTGETVTKTFTIQNTGANALNWSADLLNNNPIVSFSKESFADYKLAENQDRIAPGIWITRQDNKGLFNIAKEESYTYDNSPLGTKWQFGKTLTADNADYTDWGNAIDYDPLETINQTYSLHAANEYYDITFRTWISNDNGGGFSYERQKTAGWIKLSSSSGTIPAGESAEITLTYDPSDYLTSTKNEILVIHSDDVDEPAVQIPIQLNIQGEPEVTPSATDLAFGNVGFGFNKSLQFSLTNEGTDVLNISGIASSNPAFTLDRTTVTLQANESITVTVTFTPGAVQSYSGSLQITSNAANQSGLAVTVSGVGIQVPDVSVTPAQIIMPTTSATVFNGQIQIQNTGAADLNWSASRASNFPLSYILENLNSGFSSITDLVPSKFNFAYDGNATSINDGGYDMYDGGNILNSNLAASIAYSNNVISSGDGKFGANTKYFTRHLDGLFVMVADLNSVTDFWTTGNNGADGSGSVDASVVNTTIKGTDYTGYVKRVYGTSDPSINQLMIVESDAAIAQTYSTNTNDGLHKLTGLSNVKRVYYLLYAGGAGTYINDATAKLIMEEFLDVITNGEGYLADWLTLDTYNGTVAPGTTQTVNYTIDLTSYPEANYTTVIPVISNDPDEAMITIPVAINIGAVIVTNPIADVLVNEGFGTRSIDFSNVFIDGNSQALTYAVGSNLQIVSGSLTGTNLTLTETGTGTSIVSLRAEDPNGNVVYEDFNFRVNDIPNVANPIADLTLLHGFEPTTIAASNVFADSDLNDVLTLTVSSSDPAVIVATINSSKVITLTGGVAGTSTITLTANDGFGGVTTETFLVTVNKVEQTITFNAIANVMNSNGPIALIATSSSGLPVTFTRISGPITVTGATATLTGEIGDAVIEASQAGNEHFAAATVRRTFTITQDPILSVDDALTAHVQAYPVPAKEYLQVSTGTYLMKRVSLTDAFGRKVYTAEPNETSHSISTGSYTPGVYILQVVSQKGSVTRKVQIVK